MDRYLNGCVALCLLTFQSHWLDDLGTGAGEAAGLAVSLLGSVVVAGGWWALRWRSWRWPLATGWVFTAYISLADLASLRPDGSLAPSILEHWREGLGPAITAAVWLTLLASVAGLARLRATPGVARRPGA